jgi:hypothetical protein
MVIKYSDILLYNSTATFHERNEVIYGLLIFTRPLFAPMDRAHKSCVCVTRWPAVAVLTYLLTYLLTPWSRVLLEKLTVNFAASHEIPRIYGTRKYLTVPTSLHG